VKHFHGMTTGNPSTSTEGSKTANTRQTTAKRPNSGRTRCTSKGSSSTNPHMTTGYANHWKARTEGYESTTTTLHTPRLPQPAQPSTQYRMNTRGSTGQPTTTHQLAQSPAQPTSALTRPSTALVNQPPTSSPVTQHPGRTSRASPHRLWRAPYPHPARLTTLLHPHNLYARCPSPPSPCQTVTWHRAHIAPQCARTQNLTHAPRPSYTAPVTCPFSAWEWRIHGAASSADATHHATGQLSQTHGVVSGITTPAHIHLANTIQTWIRNRFNIPSHIHGTSSNFDLHAIGVYIRIYIRAHISPSHLYGIHNNIHHPLQIHIHTRYP
jgi:hypothetical protein